MARFVDKLINPHKTWQVSNPACSWRGVHCDQHGKISEIRWEDVQTKLTGVLQWPYLPRTTKVFTLYVYSEGRLPLTGSLPCGALPPGLNEFVLSNTNSDGGLSLEELPREIRSFDVHDNKFSGTVDLRALPETLEELFLNDNGLEGLVDVTKLPKKMSELHLYATDLAIPSDMTIPECVMI